VPDIEFEVLVTFGCSEVRARRRENWSLPVPKDMPVEEFRAVRDRIEQKVKELLVGHGVRPSTRDEAIVAQGP
jgi:hypothetical protein